MRSKIIFITAILLFLFSCNRQQEQTYYNSLVPKVVEAKGHVVPKDSMATPKVVHAGKPKVIKAGKPTIIPANTNIRLAGIPRIVKAGPPKICTSGKDPFSLPTVVTAVNKPFIAGIPDVVIAKDPGSKDQNAQNFSSFTKLQGLNSNSISCMSQDKNGNIWFGTYGGGVSRYDGKNFTNYTEKEGLSKNFVLSIFEDKTGNIWVGTLHAGVSKYDGKKFTHFSNSEGLISSSVVSILEDKSGNIWFGTDSGAYKYDGQNFIHYTEKEGLINNRVNSIIEDKSGNLWFGTQGGVSKYDGRSFANYTEKEGLGYNDISCILEDILGNIWFGTYYGGVSKYDGKYFTYFTAKEGLSNNRIISMLEDESGNFWFGTAGSGILKYDGKYITNFTEKDGLTNNDIQSIFEDRSGTIWFGTDGGVLKYNGNIFTHFTPKEGLSNNAVWRIFEDRKGSLWFGTFGGGAVKYDGKSFTHYGKKEGLSGNNVWSIIEDRAGNFWFGIEDGGIIKYDGKTFTNYTEKEGLVSNSTRCIFEDRSGNIWIGTFDKGVSKFDGKTFTNYTEKEGLSNNDVFNILEDKSGNLWFGTREGGVTKFDGKTFTHFREKEGLGTNTIASLLEDKSENLWFGTLGGGVVKYNGKTFTYFTEKEGLSNNDVWSIFEDRSGNFWFGTSFGLNKLTQKALSKLSSNAKVPTDQVNLSNSHNNDQNVSKEEVLFKTYSYEDGFLGVGINMHAILEDKNGTIWIGANDRLTVYHHEGDTRDTIVPNIQLTNIALFNENIAWTKNTTIVLSNGVTVGHFKFDSLSRWYNVPQHLSLPYNNNYLNFSFIGITTKSPQKVKYQYKLEGLEKNWSGLTTRTEAAYGNLPHGNYIFKVKAMNSEGYWSKEFSYSFTIRPPWWQTWLAYYVDGLLFIAGIYSVHRYQRKRLIRTERERARERELEQAKEIEKAYRELKTTQAQLIQSEKMASLGELTAGIAHEIQNPLNFVNNFSEVNRELIDEASQEIDNKNYDEVKNILNGIKDNEEKINHHGKRADAIVKGMLQHSKQTKGIKEPTNINALCDEYLRLSYHGMRAKDKSFNAEIKSDFGKSIGKINIVPQDMGRVLLNLFNNAFYAVNEKAKTQTGNYQPSVSVTTKKVNNFIELAVKDNGNGIPQNIVDKIFQPFFTTKPTGEGTGLGLSLSYDIINAHGGEIKVETKQGEGSEFSIQLPI